MELHPQTIDNKYKEKGTSDIQCLLWYALNKKAFYAPGVLFLRPAIFPST